MLKLILQLFFSIVFLISTQAMAGKILAVFPIPSVSHQIMHKTLIKGLAERGHEIVLITMDPFPKGQVPENVSEINFQRLSSNAWRKYNNIITSGQHSDTVYKMISAVNGINEMFEQQLTSNEMKKLIEEQNSYFDLLLLEASVMPILSLSHIFKAPVILINSFDTVLSSYDIVGAPTHPFLNPSNLCQRVYNVTIWEKVIELYTHTRLELKLWSTENNVDLMLKRHFGAEFPTLGELKNNVHMLFLNVNPIWADNRPVPSNVIFVGGIRPTITEELPQDVQTFLDRSVNGVIYVSFGSNFRPSLLPPKKLLVILNVLSELPFNVLLKWDVNRLPGAPKNIKIFNWLPQISLLKHPKIKLFITQGGLQSTEEAINAGVPLIGIPMYSDHWYNTEKYVHFHIGIQLDLTSLNEDILKDAIYAVIRDDSYRSNVAKLNILMQDQPQTSLERAIWWTEYVLRHGGALHLRSTAANISWAEYLELKFVFILIFVLLISLAVFTLLVALLFRFILNSVSDVKKKIN